MESHARRAERENHASSYLARADDVVVGGDLPNLGLSDVLGPDQRVEDGAEVDRGGVDGEHGTVDQDLNALLACAKDEAMLFARGDLREGETDDLVAPDVAAHARRVEVADRRVRGVAPPIAISWPVDAISKRTRNETSTPDAGVAPVNVNAAKPSPPEVRASCSMSTPKRDPESADAASTLMVENFSTKDHGLANMPFSKSLQRSAPAAALVEQKLGALASRAASATLPSPTFASLGVAGLDTAKTGPHPARSRRRVFA